MDLGKKSLFVFTDIESRSTSGWIALGQAFLDHEVPEFDSATEVVMLEHQAGAACCKLQIPSLVGRLTPASSAR